MGFDLASAKAVAQSGGGFDLASAKPVQSPSANLAEGEGLLRQFAHGASFGWDDELAGAASALTGGDYQSAKDAYARERDAYRAENPKSSFAANMAGGVMMAGGVGGKAAGALKGAPIAGKAAQALATMSKPAQAATIGGAAGAAQGLAQGAGDAESGHRLEGAAKGAAIGAAAGAVLSPLVLAGGRLIGSMASGGAKSTAPSAAALKAAASGKYDEARALGLQITPDAVQSASARMRQALDDAGYRDYLAPKVYRAIGELDQAGEGQAATLADLEGVRRLLGKAGGDIAERDAARQAIQGLDDFAHGLTPAYVLAGDATQAGALLNEARGNYAAAMRLGRVAGATEKAERQAASAGSGGNIDNATRQQFKAILNNPKAARGFSPDELAQMEAIVRGTPAGNVARLFGKLAPTGVVSGALSSGAGLAAGGPVGAVVAPAVGIAAKKMGDASTRRQVAKLAEMVANRSPLAEASAPSANLRANLLSPTEAAIAAITAQQGGSRLAPLASRNRSRTR